MKVVVTAIVSTATNRQITEALSAAGFHVADTAPAAIHERYAHLVEYGLTPDLVIADLTADGGVAHHHIEVLEHRGWKPPIIVLTVDAEPHVDGRLVRVLRPDTQPWQIVAAARELLGIQPGTSPK